MITHKYLCDMKDNNIKILSFLNFTEINFSPDYSSNSFAPTLSKFLVDKKKGVKLFSKGFVKV